MVQNAFSELDGTAVVIMSKSDPEGSASDVFVKMAVLVAAARVGRRPTITETCDALKSVCEVLETGIRRSGLADDWLDKVEQHLGGKS